MLVLSRKMNESIAIGNGIVIRITEVRGNRVRLLIDAPPEVSIKRSEQLAGGDAANQSGTFAGRDGKLPVEIDGDWSIEGSSGDSVGLLRAVSRRKFERETDDAAPRPPVRKPR